MKIYISGPVRGKVDYAEDFFESEKMLKGEGHEVVNPIRLMDMLPKGLTDEEFLELDMMLLKHCDTIYLLPGWRDSRGCNREYGYALAAEFAEKYLKKGTKIAVTGRIQTGSYTNRDGQKVYTTDVVIEEQEFAESKAAASGEGEQPASCDPQGFMSIPDGIEDDLPFK